MLFDIIYNLIYKLLVKLGLIKENKFKAKEQRTYIEKPLMTNEELNFFHKLTPLFSEYIIIPQVNLATIIKPNDHKRFQNELYRNIDFGIFNKDYSKVLLLIELNDKTHKEKKRQIRDHKVKDICLSAGIKLITFYSDYPNLQDYVINRIYEEIKKPL
jgi:hypothetical protein